MKEHDISPEQREIFITQRFSRLIEAIEPEQNLNETLKMRGQSISKYVDLGPPDLCYLEIEE